LLGLDLLADDRAVEAGVLGDLLDRGAQGPADDVDAGLLVAAGLLVGGVERFVDAEDRHAAAGQDAFFDRRAAGVQRVFDAGLLLFHLDLGRGADVDLGHAAGELREALFELLAVVVAGGRLDLVLDRLDAALDVDVLPAPSMIVQVSLSMMTRLARPSSLSWSFSRLMPRSSKTAVPPVRIAMSSSMALRRSPKPGALTRRTGACRGAC
jgi:hypothetical protein